MTKQGYTEITYIIEKTRQPSLNTKEINDGTTAKMRSKAFSKAI